MKLSQKIYLLLPPVFLTTSVIVSYMTTQIPKVRIDSNGKTLNKLLKNNKMHSD